MYQHYQHSASYPQYTFSIPTTGQAQEPYAASSYHHAWYNYYGPQLQAHMQQQQQQQQQQGQVGQQIQAQQPQQYQIQYTTPQQYANSLRLGMGLTPTGSVAPIPTATTTNALPTTGSSSTGSFASYAPSTYSRDTTNLTSSATNSGPRGRKQSQLKGLFSKELPKLMYGFGDDKNPAYDSVSVLEEILIEYIVDVCQSALIATPRKNRLQIEDIRRTLQRPADAKKLARMEELLFMQEDIKRARKQFDQDDMKDAEKY